MRDRTPAWWNGAWPNSSPTSKRCAPGPVENIEQGPITDAYGADRDRVIEVLNEALATELVCVLRYKRHFYTASGLNAAPVAAEFLQHANEEQVHADQIALRITQLQGAPNFDPDGLASRSHSEYDASTNLLADGEGRPDRRARRDRELQRDHPVARRQGFDDPADARGHPGGRGGARRRPAEHPRRHRRLRPASRFGRLTRQVSSSRRQ